MENVNVQHTKETISKFEYVAVRKKLSYVFE